MGVATFMETQLDQALTSYVTSTSQALTVYLVPIAGSLVSLYYAWTALAMMRGDVNEPGSKLTKDVFTMTLVFMVALSFGQYQNFVIQGVYGLVSDLTSRVAAGGGDSVGVVLDRIFSDCVAMPGEAQCYPADEVLWKLALKHSNAIGFPEFSYALASLTLGAAEMVIVVLCLLPVLLSKVALAVFLALGPPFILCLAWPVSRQYFNSWLSVTLGNALTLVIVAAICAIVPVLFQQLLAEGWRNLPTDGSAVYKRMLGILIAAIGLGFTALKASQMGAQLAGGGVAMDGSGFAGQVINAVTNMVGRKQGGNPSNAPSSSDSPSSPNNTVNQGSPGSYKAGHVSGRAVKNVLDALNKRK